MKTRTSRKFTKIFFLIATATASPLAAQEDVVISQLTRQYTPHFFMAILGGVILAIGFQILLTSLSVASGISLIGDVEKKGEEAQDRK